MFPARSSRRLPCGAETPPASVFPTQVEQRGRDDLECAASAEGLPVCTIPETKTRLASRRPVAQT